MNHDDFIKRVRQRFAAATIEVISFPSGLLDVSLRQDDRFVVIQHSARTGFGVSLIGPDTAGFDNHDDFFSDIDGVLDHVEKLLRDDE